MIDLNPKHLETIRHILAQYALGCEVRAFGSRVKWTAKDYSDLDLAVIGRRRFNPREMHRLTEAFEESNLPIRVDVVDWYAISEGFKRVIAAKYEVIQRPVPIEPSEGSESICGKSDSTDVQFVQFEKLFDIPLRNGLTRPRAVRGSGVKMVNMGELFAHSRIGNVSMERVPLSETESKKYLLKKGDLLFARQSLVPSGAGKCSIFLGASEPITYEGHLIRARLDSSIANPAFYFYFFNSRIGRQVIESIVEQVAAAGIRGSDLAKLSVPYFSVQKQHRIAEILGTLDDKIELNQQMNETLEATARAIFKSWFVDFDPVKAKMEGRKPACMDTETAALFPSAFQDSPLGKIPEGWNVGTLGEIAKNVRRSIKASEIDSNECFIGLEHMPRRSIALSQWQVDAEIASNKYRFKQGEILFGKLNPHFHKVGVTPIDGICSTDILVIQPIDAEWFGVVLSLVSSDNFVAYTKAFSKGTTLPRTNWKDMSSYKTVLPEAQIVGKYTDFTQPIVKRIIENIHECHTLSQTRDALLPKLLSGEIRVDAAAEILEVEDGRQS